MASGGADDLLTKLIDKGDKWDPIEEQSALAEIQSELFSEPFKPFSLDRYVILEPLGSGGGGIVYRAYDPDLHRKVAVKVLRTGDGSTAVASNARLLREAQAIAQLSHPNVVSVYDVGTLDHHVAAGALGQGVFMVMELVEGADLREWLRSTKRSWREVLDVFMAAGRGLEAAHAQGIIHRDFKPTNVLVGEDGRVRVLDFGLARALDGDGDEPEPSKLQAVSKRALLDHDLTDAGTVMGTPGYMAPEQHLGKTADARTDQYGFCVALHEALSDARPFEGETLDELLAAKRAGPRPVGGASPRWVGDAVLRGLEVEPDRRFGSMTELLAALDRDPARRRRRILQGLALVGAAGLGTYAVANQGQPSAAACEDPSARLAGVWDEATRSQARQAFDDTGLAYASQTWPGVEAALDEYAEAWKTARTQTCEATLVEGEQSPEAMALQMLCLDQQFEGFAQLARLMAQADEPVVRNAVSATSKLPSPADCRQASDHLEERLDLEGHEREEMLALDAQLLRASVLSDAGKYDETRSLTEEVLNRASELGAHRAEARARLVLCELDWVTNHFDTARGHCEAGLVAAEKGQSSPLVFEILVRLGRITMSGGSYPETERIFSIAQARLESIPAAQRPELAEGELHLGMGLLRDQQWREAEAADHLEKALALYEEEYPPDHPELVSVLNGLGMVAAARDLRTTSSRYYERALQISEKRYGPAHPHVASLLNNISGVEYERGQLDDALGSAFRALELKEQNLGPDSPRLSSTLTRIGRALADVGRGEQALGHHERAVRLQEAANGEESFHLLNPLTAHARTLRILGRCEQARPVIERAHRIVEQHADALSASASEVLFERAKCAAANQQLDAALADFGRALQIETSYVGDDGRSPATMQLEIAEIHLARGETEAALALLRDAERRCDATEGDPLLGARVKFARARAVHSRSPEESQALVSEARALLEGRDHSDQLDAAIDAWSSRGSG